MNPAPEAQPTATDTFQGLTGEPAGAPDRAETLADLRAKTAALEAELAESRHRERALQEETTLFRSIIEGAADSIFVKDRAGRYTLINEAGAAVLGRSVEAVLGCCDDTLFSPDTARLLREEDESVMAARKLVTLESMGTTALGQNFECLVNKSPLFDAAGNVIGVIGNARNIMELRTKERQSRIRARQQQVVAELGRRALAGLGLETLFAEAVSQVAETLEVEFSLVLEHLPERRTFVRRAGVGCPPEMVGAETPHDREDFCAGFTLATREPVSVLDIAQEKRFGLAPWMLNLGATSGLCVLIAGESDVPAFGVLNTFSAQRREFTPDDLFFLQSVANVLAAATERRRTEEALGQARGAAEKADHAKSEFLSRMSHELRTPLNAILGFGQLLEISTLDGRQRESTSHILKAGRHLLGLIDEVLDVARIESGHLDLDLVPVETELVLRDCVAMLRPAATARSISLVLEGRVGATSPESRTEVRADERRLRQIILNLLSNAVKYSHPTSRVTLTLTPTPASGGRRIRLSVRDTGPGISPEDLTLLFTPFERLGAQYTGTEGSGLGLVLTKRLTEAMGGTIGVESSPGEGSHFWVEFDAAEPPVAPGPLSGTAMSILAGCNGSLATAETTEGLPAPDEHAAEADSSRPPASAAAPELTILQIEDNESNRRLLERVVLFCPGVRLLSTDNGSAGLLLAREERPDLIFLDLHLPDLAGDEILRRVKADPDLAGIEVVMVTADVGRGRAEALLAAGAASYLTKPLSVRGLLDVIENATLRSSLARGGSKHAPVLV